MDRNPIESLRELANQNEDSNTNIIDFYLDLFLEITNYIKDSIFLKGNILLNKLLPEMARATKDLDFDVLNKEIFKEFIKPNFIEIYSGISKIYISLKEVY